MSDSEAEPEDYVWIYIINGKNRPKKSKKIYEFHEKLQEHVEKSYQAGKDHCKVYVYGNVWTVNFRGMYKTRKAQNGNTITYNIKRIDRANLRRNHVSGIAGLTYDKPSTFIQTDPVCRICFYELSLETKIESCGHIFCFMCLKNNYNSGKECPICRTKIPPNVFDAPICLDMDIHMKCPDEYNEDCTQMFDMTLEKGKVEKRPVSRSNARIRYYWIYESHNHGWYRYDPKHERCIEEAYLRKRSTCNLLVSGHQMTIDFKSLIQKRTRTCAPHIRKIKRIKSTEVDKYTIKGIAGVRGYVRVIE